MRKKLPIGIQTFAKIRENDAYYYVDKTPFALELIENGTHYFLSRPRRFGKSLFLDTLKELFEGNRDLFRGLYAATRWDWSVRYPVVSISFGGGHLKSRDDLLNRLSTQLSRIEAEKGVTPPSGESIAERFRSLLIHCHHSTGRRVVVLVDEYDKPILDVIEKRETAREMRDTLKDLYSVIKESDPHVRFAFLTGVTKFSKVSLFSGLNNLVDITIDRRYSAICGYRESDLDQVFGPELEGIDRELIRQWYDGYGWTGESVYNPFDLLLYFDTRTLRPFWFETGSPSFLVKLLLERKQFLPDLAAVTGGDALLSAFDVDRIETEALLFQTGYLTIKNVEEAAPGQWFYTLSWPNREVESSLTETMLTALSDGARGTAENRARLLNLLRARDFDGMRELFHSFYATIPHDWYRRNRLQEYEGYYGSIFYAYFASLGLEITLEDVTNRGRVDMTVRFDGDIFLFEFKVVEILPGGKALEQLKTKGYAEKYRSLGRPIHLIGVEFSRDTRNIVSFQVETIP